MTPRELVYFTGHLLGLDEHPGFRQEAIDRICSGGVDWDYFVQFCSDELIIPAVCLKMRKHRLLNLLPEELVTALKEIYELNAHRNQQILRQIDDITALLNRENIFPVFLKGSGNLLSGLYHDIGERMMGDIDLLVEEDDYLKAGKLLESAGYSRSDKVYVDILKTTHYPRLFRKGTPADVEIHRIPVSEKYAGALSARTVLRQKVSVGEKQGCYVESDEHKVIHTFLHSQMKDFGHRDKKTSFRGLYDLYLLSERVDITALTKSVPYPEKMGYWIILTKRILGLTESFYPAETPKAQRYYKRYDRSLRFYRSHRLYTFFMKLYDLLAVRYGGRIIRAIFVKGQWKEIYIRVKDPQWYGLHFANYKEHF
ncbi:MAG: nucleotidyltransferase family protein [Prolixibacteraceae bacterium]|nr:nucleotidyltransferase family protein [Prolixibacteraceae bacterium]